MPLERKRPDVRVHCGEWVLRGESAVTSDDCDTRVETQAPSQGASVRTDAVMLQKQAAPFLCQALCSALNKP